MDIVGIGRLLPLMGMQLADHLPNPKYIKTSPPPAPFLFLIWDSRTYCGCYSLLHEIARTQTLGLTAAQPSLGGTKLTSAPKQVQYSEMAHDISDDPYKWDKRGGWRSYRPLRPGKGMYHDVRRRLPYYWSDIRDGFTYRVFAATVRMYFVK